MSSFKKRETFQRNWAVERNLMGSLLPCPSSTGAEAPGKMRLLLYAHLLVLLECCQVQGLHILAGGAFMRVRVAGWCAQIWPASQVPASTILHPISRQEEPYWKGKVYGWWWWLPDVGLKLTDPTPCLGLVDPHFLGGGLLYRCCFFFCFKDFLRLRIIS